MLQSKKNKALIFFLLFLSLEISAQKMETIVQMGHSAAVKSAVYSSNGKYLATASRDKTIKIWESESGNEIRTLFGHQHTVNQVAFSKSGRFLASSSADKTAKVWDVLTGKELFTVEHTNYNTAIAFSPDEKLLATGGVYGYVDIWDWKNNALIKRMKVSPDMGLGYGVNLSFNDEGGLFFIGEDNYQSRIYNTNNWVEEHSFSIERGSCGGCVSFGDFSNDNTFYRLERENLKQYDLNSGEEINSIYLEGLDDVQSFAYHAGLGAILLCMENSTLLFKPDVMDTLYFMSDENTEFNGANLSPKAEELVISTNDNKAIIYKVAGGENRISLEGILNYQDKGGILYDPNNYWTQHIAKYIKLKSPALIINDDKQLLKGKLGKNIRSIQLNTGQPVGDYANHSKAVLSMDISSDGNKMVASDGAGGIYLWDLKKSDTIRSYGQLNSPVFEVKFSSDEQYILSTSWDGNVIVWDTETAELKTRIYFDNYAGYTANFTPNDLYIVIAGLNNSLEMYEIDTGVKVKSFIGHKEPVQQISFNQKGEMLSCSWDGTVRLWNIETALMVNKWTFNFPVYTAFFNELNNELIIGGGNRGLQIIDLSNKNKVSVLEGHQASVVNALLFDQGKKMVSIDLDGTSKIWDLEKRKEIYEHIQINANEWMVKSPEGYFMGTDGAMEIVHFVSGMNTYNTAQFFDTYYRPELMRSLFQDLNNKERKGINEKLKSSPPPKIKLEGSTKNEGKNAVLLVKATNTGGGVHDIRVYHNKKRMSLTEKRVLIEKKDTVVYQFECALAAGENLFEAIAYSDKGIASKASSVNLRSDYGGIPAVAHVLIVGINEYKNELLKLNYARPDAEAMYNLLNNKSQLPFSEIRIHNILDKNASRDNILKKLDEIAAQVQLQDVFIFYYAGHGSMVEDEFYFVPTEMTRLFDKSKLEESAISANDIQKKFLEIKALKQLVIMDACQSGASVDVLAKRGLMREKAMAQLSRSSGVHILAAAGSDQYATEYEQLGHGLFTYFILEGLKGAADGLPKDGKVTVFELKSYLDEKVPAYSQKHSGSAQYPYTFSKGNDFPLMLNE